jgi:hypothetical protein
MGTNGVLRGYIGVLRDVAKVMLRSKAGGLEGYSRYTRGVLEGRSRRV